MQVKCSADTVGGPEVLTDLGPHRIISTLILKLSGTYIGIYDPTSMIPPKKVD